MDKKSEDIRERNDKMNTIFSGIMSICTITLFLITGIKEIMYYTGIVLCMVCIFNFFIDIIFNIKDRNKKVNIKEDA